MANCKELSGGKYADVYHFDGKAIGEEYGRSTYPKLWEKTNVFYAGYYLENYFGPAGGLFRPKLVCSNIFYLEKHDFTSFIWAGERSFKRENKS